MEYTRLCVGGVVTCVEGCLWKFVWWDCVDMAGIASLIVLGYDNDIHIFISQPTHNTITVQ